MTHPTRPGQQVSVTAPTSAEVMVKVEHLRDTRKRVRAGILDPHEGDLEVARLAGEVSTVRALFARHRKTISNPRYLQKFDSVVAHSIEPHFGGRHPASLTTTEIEVWIAALRRGSELRKPLAAATVRGAFDLLNAVYHRALDEDVIRRIPWRRTQLSGLGKKRRGFQSAGEREALRDMTEVERVIAAAVAHDEEHGDGGRRFVDLAQRIVVLIFCGLRQGEGCGLAWSDVRPRGDGAELCVERQVTPAWARRNPGWVRPMDLPKYEKTRTQLLSAPVIQALAVQRERLEAHGFYDPLGPIFPRHTTVRGRDAWRKSPRLVPPELLRELGIAAGIPRADRLVTHGLRHTFGTLEARLSGGDIRHVADRLGHADTDTAQGYTHSVSRGAFAPALAPALRSGLLPGAPSAADLEAGGAGVSAGSPEALRGALRSHREAYAERERTRERRATANEQRRAKRAKAAPRGLAAVTNEWIAAGKPGVRPAEVTRLAEQARERARARAIVAGTTHDAAAKAGQFAFTGTVARFKRELHRIEGLEAATVSASTTASASASTTSGRLEDEKERRRREAKDAWNDAQKRARAERRAAGERDGGELGAAIRAWVAAECPGNWPPEVAAAARARAETARAKAKLEGASNATAERAAELAYNRQIGRFRQEVTKLEAAASRAATLPALDADLLG